MLGFPSFSFVSSNRLHIGALGDIRLDCDRLLASFDDLADHTLGVGPVRGVVDRNGRSRLGESSGDRRADPFRRSGDDCDFPVELAHDSRSCGPSGQPPDRLSGAGVELGRRPARG
jgi:hypothetical protein